MFLTITNQGYTDRGGSQFAQGRFLLFMQPETGNISADCAAPIRCLVRHARMSQCGHFMMGSVRVKGQSLTVSGTYGSDGLPLSVSPAIYALGVELPAELREAWNLGGGWNGPGAEACAIEKWARQTFAI